MIEFESHSDGLLEMASFQIFNFHPFTFLFRE